MRQPDSYQVALETLAQQHSLRVLHPVSSDGTMGCHVKGYEAVNFSSNNYLGLAQDPRLIEASTQATLQYGTGSGASRLVCGTSELALQLEEVLCSFKQAEAALVLNSGYQANVGILQGLLEPGDWVIGDKLNHASLVDGCLLSRATFKRYRHLDFNHLEKLLQQARASVSAKQKIWVVTDSVFSMDGDYAPLNDWVALAEQYGAYTLVDEAHGTGIFGPHRRSGLAEEMGVSQRISLQMGTFSKALGGFGAYVAGSSVLIQTLVNRSRSFIYSTALPPGVMAAALKALEIVQAEGALTQALWSRIATFNELAEQNGLTDRAQSPIIPILIGEEDAAMAASQRLLEQGYFVQGIRPPTVPVGTARLRVTLSAAHQEEDIEGLVKVLRNLRGSFHRG